MNKKVILFTITGVIATILLFLSIGAVIAARVPAYATHYHANFAVFVNGTQISFAKPELMHLKPCKIDDDPALHPKLENVHLHDMVGNVVHVHDDGLIWNDLFESIKYKITDESQKNNLPTYFYLNDVKTDLTVLNKIIGKNDRLLVTMTSEQLPQKVQDNQKIREQMNIVGNNAADYDSQSTESCSGNAERSWQIRLRIGLNRIF